MIREIGVEVIVGSPRQSSTRRPPVAALWLLRAMVWLAPPDARAEWNARWSGRLWNLWVLVERGEFAGYGGAQTALLCRDAIAAAFWMRFNRASFHRWQRGPGFVLCSAIAALCVLALLSRGFSATRHVIITAIEWKMDKLAPKLMRYDPRGDLVVGHFVPLAMAFLVGVAMVLLGGRALRYRGWRYWLFLASKLLLVSLVVPLVWIEGNGVLRAHIVPGALLFAMVLAFTLTFLGTFGASVIWAFADQRQRCPVCLGRLALPVTFGSWASVFDPATTEMVCDEGHGSMCVAESGIGPEDRWIKLDSSWTGF